MTRNILDEFRLILSEPKEPDKDRIRTKRENRTFLGYGIGRLHLFDLSFLRELHNSTPLLGWYRCEAISCPQAIPSQEEIIERVLRAITRSPSQDYSSSSIQSVGLFCKHQTNPVHRSGYNKMLLEIMASFLDTIAEMPIAPPEHGAFMSGSYHRSTRIGPLDDCDITLRLSLLENLYLEETDELEGIDAFVVANGVTMNLVLKRSLAPEDKSRGMERLLKLCKYGKEIGVYMWKVDDELIEAE